MNEAVEEVEDVELKVVEEVEVEAEAEVVEDVVEV